VAPDAPVHVDAERRMRACAAVEVDGQQIGEWDQDVANLVLVQCGEASSGLEELFHSQS
jgi:hypothetical protein